MIQRLPRPSSSRLDGLMSRWSDALLVGVLEGLGRLHAQPGDRAEEAPDPGRGADVERRRWRPVRP